MDHRTRTDCLPSGLVPEKPSRHHHHRLHTPGVDIGIVNVIYGCTDPPKYPLPLPAHLFTQIVFGANRVNPLETLVVTCNHALSNTRGRRVIHIGGTALPTFIRLEWGGYDLKDFRLENSSRNPKLFIFVGRPRRVTNNMTEVTGVYIFLRLQYHIVDAPQLLRFPTIAPYSLSVVPDMPGW